MFPLCQTANHGAHGLTSRMSSLANEVKRPPETTCLRDENN